MVSKNTTMYEELLRAMRTGVKPVHWSWTASFIVGKQTIPVMKIVTDKQIHSYSEATSVVRVLVVHVSRTDYANYIYPNKDRLQLRLERHINTREGVPVGGRTTDSQTFAAFLCDPTSPFVISNSIHTESGSERDNNAGPAEFVVQLVDKPFLAYSAINFGGSVYNAKTQYTLDTILKGVMTRLVDLGDGQTETISVDVAPIDNVRIFPAVLIPQSDSLLDLPHRFQHQYGLYATGIGYYYHRSMIYIYPILDATRFYKVKKTLTIVIMDRDAVPTVDISYLQRDNGTVIFATGNVDHIDYSEHAQFNQGNAVRYAVRSNFPEAFADTRGGIIRIPPGQNRKNVVMKDRANGPNRFSMPEKMISDNPYQEMSRIAEGLSAVIKVNWDYANPDLIYPGIPTKVLYRQRGKVVSLLGTVIACDIETATERASVTDKRYLTKCSLTIQCQQETLYED